MQLEQRQGSRWCTKPGYATVSTCIILDMELMIGKCGDSGTKASPSGKERGCGPAAISIMQTPHPKRNLLIHHSSPYCTAVHIASCLHSQSVTIGTTRAHAAWYAAPHTLHGRTTDKMQTHDDYTLAGGQGCSHLSMTCPPAKTPTMAFQDASMCKQRVIDNQYGWILGQLTGHGPSRCVHALPSLFLLLNVLKVFTTQACRKR